ncbi:MAG: hypothetical protein WAM53_16960 [Terrimicrobiaceae bacterium]
MQDNEIACAVKDIHRLYCQLTGQQLTLRYDRERLWFEFLRAGFAPQELRRVVRYLQKEIRAGRRNVGALKLSNLLQLDRFDEDLNISQVRLRVPCASAAKSHGDPPTADQETLRQQALIALRHFREHLRCSRLPQ